MLHTLDEKAFQPVKRFTAARPPSADTALMTTTSPGPQEETTMRPDRAIRQSPRFQAGLVCAFVVAYVCACLAFAAAHAAPTDAHVPAPIEAARNG